MEENIKSNVFVVKDKSFLKEKFYSKIDPFINDVTCEYDFFDKKKSHFSIFLPYQFLYRLNRSYDCFLLSMYYDLLLTYFVCYFILGLL